MVAAEKNRVVIIEADDPTNSHLYFRPIQERLRGRFDRDRVQDKHRHTIHDDCPEPIPGQRLSVNLDTGVAEIIEPIHDPQYAALRQRIEKSGRSLPPARRALKNGKPVHLPTYLYWMRISVEGGLARITEGALPDDVGGKPQLKFRGRDGADEIHELGTAVTKLTELVDAQTKLLLAMAEKQK